ncbi:InlB B-repeat-containing protein [Listeria swaminathanii]|uniref:InlB B-repeat-containing protein n=1 Tax=Listeria swaminathanii TaxID=2713501 RepID=A0ABU2IDB2_9LIST|nr:InlB B-repeat-containing protein [Listeria swaminathanii]MDT0016042.1 InlB B-repeat-containing protein [Listeria swaminathanii]MDT0021478.1 InlB B-repeat-containing protein [Listeria swaminathanii]MDT0032442.1 InlB B-repeat-containing protein [Listeria swaminathanii]MDT0051708.1 InlB B-repeat-containing protein [Listeria swaminathanii]MDT0054473.1 InlB B-repeat-containing protein [Listeria swaminathanii]
MKKMMTLLLLALSVFIISFVSSPKHASADTTDILQAPKPINEIFPDEGVAQLVARETGKSTTSEVSQADLDGITKLNDTIQSSRTVPMIYSLEGVEYLHNLRELAIPNHSVSDISALEGLAELRIVDIRYSNVSDLSPLSKSKEITHLDAIGNNISDISVFSSFSKINQVVLGENNISDISVLKDFPADQFVYIYLDNNKIKDISPLSGKAFHQLTLNDNEISDVSPLSTMTLYSDYPFTDNFYIDISNNHISDISPLKNTGFSKLNYFYAENQSVTSPSKTFSNDLTLENSVKNIEGKAITPEIISNNGSYSGSMLNWQLPNFVANVDYSFSETNQIGQTTGVFSGKVSQPLVDGFTVTFDNEGSISTESYKSDVIISEPTEPTKEGFTFEGWYDASTGGKKWDFATDKMPANDITLYAQFTETKTEPANPVFPVESEESTDLGDSEDSANPSVTEDTSKLEIAEKATKNKTTQASEKAPEKIATSELPKTGDSSPYLILLGLVLVGASVFAWKKKQA